MNIVFSEQTAQAGEIAVSANYPLPKVFLSRKSAIGWLSSV
jgi:hypothetical protein